MRLAVAAAVSLVVLALGAAAPEGSGQLAADGSHPVRLTNHPAWDGWASYVRLQKPSRF